MIIGLVGYKQVGKSTVAQHIADKYGYSRFNMKDALIAELKENFPDLLQMLCNVYLMDIDELFKEKPPLVRALMQNYGSDVRRKDNDRYWIDKWLEKTAGIKNVVVDDIRFQNEADAITNQGGVLIRIERDDVATGGDHQSEQGASTIHCKLSIQSKKGELDILYNRVDEVFKKVLRLR